MPITINGSGTVTGLSAGGLPDDSINLADLSATGTASSSTFLRGDNSWAAAGGGKILQVVRNYNAGPVTSTNTDWTDLFSSDLSITVSSNSNPIILFATWISRLAHSSSTTGDFESSHLLKVTTSGETNNNVGTRPAGRAKNVQELRDTLTGMWFYTGYTATTQTFMWQHEKGSHATSLESKWIHSVILEVEA